MKWSLPRGHTSWNEHMSEALNMLFNAGGDFHHEAKDGCTAWGLLQSNQKELPVPSRAGLIAEIKVM